MKLETINHSYYNQSLEYRPNVPFITPPVVKKKKIIIDGREYYRGENGRLHLADVYDRIFKCAVKLKILPKKKKSIIGRALTIER